MDGWFERVGIPIYIPPISLSLKDTQKLPYALHRFS